MPVKKPAIKKPASFYLEAGCFSIQFIIRCNKQKYNEGISLIGRGIYVLIGN